MNKVIPIDIYNTDLLFVIGTQEELRATLEKHLSTSDFEESYNVMVEDMDDLSLGRTALLSNGAVALWLPDDKNKGAIVHELFHAVCFIMEKVGISLCHKSDEAFAYLLGYLTNKVDELLTSSSE